MGFLKVFSKTRCVMNKLNIKLIRKFSDSCQEASGEINQKLDSSKVRVVLFFLKFEKHS